jgi:hypothetical protein
MNLTVTVTASDIFAGKMDALSCQQTCDRTRKSERYLREGETFLLIWGAIMACALHYQLA